MALSLVLTSIISKSLIEKLFFISTDRIPFSANIPGKLASGLNPTEGHSS